MSYIYVMQNDGLPGLVQIGMTDDNPEARAQELSNITGALGRFTVALRANKSETQTPSEFRPDGMEG